MAGELVPWKSQQPIPNWRELFHDIAFVQSLPRSHLDITCIGNGYAMLRRPHHIAVTFCFNRDTA